MADSRDAAEIGRALLCTCCICPVFILGVYWYTFMCGNISTFMSVGVMLAVWGVFLTCCLVVMGTNDIVVGDARKLPTRESYDMEDVESGDPDPGPTPRASVLGRLSAAVGELQKLPGDDRDSSSRKRTSLGQQISQMARAASYEDDEAPASLHQRVPRREFAPTPATQDGLTAAVVWQVKLGDWKDFDNEIQAIIKTAVEEDQGVVQFERSGTTYQVDISNSCQVNMATGFRRAVRSIRRLGPAEAAADDGAALEAGEASAAAPPLEAVPRSPMPTAPAPVQLLTHSMPTPTAFSSQDVWQFKLENGWKDFAMADQRILETAYRQGTSMATLELRTPRGVDTLEVHFNELYQKNTRTGRKRDIRLKPVLAAAPGSAGGFVPEGSTLAPPAQPLASGGG
eukprot:TRINITY_DN5523_c0_g1_i1.p1 TRINITY_DN5523_c0_g1~~TRINITY_DN5523_c0_g1_i1.p1  ORF type:complete len:399 (-),score=84.82 TRINITY_DN5523_c0_g1_i1:297-1493(-)